MNPDSLHKKKHVKCNPIITSYRERARADSELLKAHKEALDSSDLRDMFSISQSKYSKDKKLPGLIKEAISVTSDLLAQFNFPIFPKISTERPRNIRYAAHDNKEVVSGVINLNCKISSFSGVDIHTNIPVHIDRGEIIVPSIMIHDGRESIISQSLIDELVDRNTSYALEPLRGEFDPFNDFEDTSIAVDARNVIGYQPRMINYLDSDKNFSNQDSGPHDYRSGSMKDKGLPSAYSEVKSLMDKAIEDNKDNFPRSWQHVYETYIIPVVGSANQSDWESFLMNDGYVLNPYGQNRGRPVHTFVNEKKSVQAQEMYDVYVELGEDVEPDVEIMDVEDLVRSMCPADSVVIEWVEMDDPDNYEIQETEVCLSTEDTSEEEDLKNCIMAKFGRKAQEIEDAEAIEPVSRMWPGTKAPMELGDKAKFLGNDGPIRGTIITVDPEDDYLIIESKGMRYQVHVEDIEPMPGTFKKMYLDAE